MNVLMVLIHAHPLLRHQLGHLLPETRVQQGDRLRPWSIAAFFSTQRLISSIHVDAVLWYLNDGHIDELGLSLIGGHSHQLGKMWALKTLCY